METNTNFPASIAQIIDEYKIVINRGAAQGVTIGQRFLVYSLSDEEIVDPDNGEKLGYLELVKGTAKVIHVQEKISTLESDKREPPKVRVHTSGIMAFLPEKITEQGDIMPLEDPKVGDKVKPI